MDGEDYYIYINGIRYVNPKYNGPNVYGRNGDVYQKFDQAGTEEEKMAVAQAICDEVKKVTNAFVIDTALDDKIKTFMSNKSFQNTSLGYRMNCPFCDISIHTSSAPKHFLHHKYIFTRGCVYCNCELPVDLMQYYMHIKLYHSENKTE